MDSQSKPKRKMQRVAEVKSEDIDMDSNSSSKSNDKSSSSSWNPDSCSSSNTSTSSSSSESLEKPAEGERRSKRNIQPRKIIYDPDLSFGKKQTKSRGRGRPAAVKVEQRRAAPKTELELLRERNIVDRQKFIEQSGLMKAKEEFDVVSRKGRPKGSGSEKKQSQSAPREKSSRDKASHQFNTALMESSQDITNFEDLGKNMDLNDCITSAFTAEDMKMFIDVAKIVSEERSKIIHETEMSAIQFPVLQSRLLALQSHYLCDPELPNNKFTTVVFHPSTSPRLLAGGTKSGSVCLWRVTEDEIEMQSKSEVVSLNVHSGPINQLMFGTNQPHFLFSNSVDGCLKYMDLNREEFTLLYKLPSQGDGSNWVNWQAQLGPNVIVAATSQGTLLRLDTREESIKLTSFKCHNFSINTVDTMGESSILTASEDGSFSLWDMKAMGGSMVVPSQVLSGDSLSRGRKWNVSEAGAVASAFFSPQGGSRLLTSSKNTANVYNHGHNLTPFRTYSTCGSGYFNQKDTCQRAYWHPLRRDVLIFSLSLHPMTGVGISHARNLVNRRFPCAPDIHLRDPRSITEAIFHPTQMLIAACSGSKIQIYE